MPDVPRLDETFGPFGLRVWIGITGPAAMPDAAVQRTAEEFARLFGESRFQQWLSENGVQNGIMGPQEFAKLLRSDRDDAAMFVKKYNSQVN